MRTFDFTPYYRSTVGFDRLFDLLDQSIRSDWPPYNIENKGELHGSARSTSNGPNAVLAHICTRHGQSDVFARSRCPCEGASVSGVGFWRAGLRSSPPGFERIDHFADEHGYAQASFSTPQSGK